LAADHKVQKKIRWSQETEQAPFGSQHWKRTYKKNDKKISNISEKGKETSHGLHKI
jgi:hypothetical protein